MRLIFTFLFFIVSITSFPQKLTGIWRGTFVQRQSNPFSGEWQTYTYRYEVQINQIDAKTIEGVTYSYKQKEFYGKAAFRGMFTQATQNVILKETKMLELRASESAVPCLMTCYLDYSKVGDVERLKGTFSSVESSGQGNCGGGTIALQRVLNSDFKKENFLAKDNNTPPNKNTVNSSRKYIQALQTALGLNADGIVGPKTLQAIKQKIPTFNNKLNVNDSVEIKNLIAQLKTKTGAPANTAVVKNNTTPAKAPQKTDVQNQPAITTPFENLPATTAPPLTAKITAMDSAITKEVTIKKPINVPAVLKLRVNKLVNTIIVHEKNLIIDYYDNGEIDGDIISVYDNNVMVINHDTLSTKPLRLYLHMDENNAYHELITVAENLGRIPPNTCLMVITAGRQRFEFPMSSDEKTNAKIILEYHSLEGTKIATPQH